MKSARSLAWFLCLSATAMLVFVIGCKSSDRGAVQGAVTFAGDPVDQGGIAFIPAEDGAGTALVRATGQIENGRYEFDDYRGPNPGKYRVELTWHKKTGKKVPGEGGVMKDETNQVLPAKYNSASELTVDVKPGLNTFNFDLKK